MLVSPTLNCDITHPKWIETPTVALSNQSEDSAKVVREHGRSKPGCVNQTCSLEQVFFLIEELRCALGVVGRNAVRIDVGSSLINLKQLLGNVLDKVE